MKTTQTTTKKIVQLDIFGEAELVECGVKRSRAEVLNDYDAFEKKFETAKTTDDCYTPAHVFEAVRQWVNDNIMPLDAVNIVRPFYPGGDYAAYDYQPGDFVLDNPPFSILAEIRRLYIRRNIPFFLFAPALTLTSALDEGDEDTTFIVAGASVTYANKAVISTSFITNRMPGRPIISVRGDLHDAIEKAERIHAQQNTKTLPVFDYPDTVITAARLGKIAKQGASIDFARDESEYVRALDAQRKRKKSIFGNGFFISERLAAERLAAERLAAIEKITWELSERERAIIDRLNAVAESKGFSNTKQQ